MSDPTQTPPKAADDARAAAPNERPRRGAGWLSKIAPGVRSFVQRKDTPDNLWVKCPETGEMIYRADLDAAMWVTPSGHHMRIGPDRRFRLTFDGGRYETIAAPDVSEDPLGFVDQKPYPERLSAARRPREPRTPSPSATAKSTARPPWRWCRTSPSWAGRWAWRRARASSSGRNGDRARRSPGGLHRGRPARGCRKAR